MLLGTHEVVAWLDAGPAHQLFRTEHGELLYRFAPTLTPEERVGLQQPLLRLLDIVATYETGAPRPLERSFHPAEWLMVIDDPIGRTAADLSSGDLRVGHVLWLVHDVLTSLIPIHDAGLFHGAISPSRIQVDPHGRAAVLDIGAALLAEQMSRGELRPATRGFSDLYREPACLPPELLLRGGLSPASDIFSIAAVAFRLIAGRPAHRGDRVLQVYGHLRQGEHAHFMDLAAEVPPGVARLLDAALAADPLARPRARAITEAIESAAGLTFSPPTSLVARATSRWSADLPERPVSQAPGPPGSEAERARQDAIRRASLALELGQRRLAAAGPPKRRLGLLITLIVLLGLAGLWPLIARRGGDQRLVPMRPEQTQATLEDGAEAEDAEAAPRRTIEVTLGGGREIQAPRVPRRVPERESRRERYSPLPEGAHRPEGSSTR